MFIQLLTFIISVMTFGLVELAEIDYTHSNNYPISELGDKTLSEIFTVDYKTTDIIALNNQSLNDVFENPKNYRDYTHQWLGNNGTQIENGSNYDRYYGSISTNNVYANLYTVNADTYYMILNVKNGNAIATWRYYPVNGTYVNLVSVNFDDYREYTAKVTTSASSFPHFTNSSNTNDMYLKYVKWYSLTELGISVLTVEQMDAYYTAFTSTDILLEAFNDYNNLSITQEQLDVYQTLYEDNLLLDIPYEYTINSLSTTDLIILISSLSLWALAIIIIKEVL